MLSLIETVTGFAAIMLMLSLLVKTLTSVVKNQFDYYSDNLEHEVKRLAWETMGQEWNRLTDSTKLATGASWVNEIHWKRLGDDYLTPANMKWLLKSLGATDAQLADLEDRVKMHLANVKYAFEMRMKNLSLAVGLGLCLFMNINALTIWKTLYTDQQLRATFANSSYATKAIQLAEEDAKKEAAKTKGTSSAMDKQTTDKQPMSKPAEVTLSEFQQGLQGFLTDVKFGVGRIWRDGKPLDRTAPEFFLYEFFGSLLTGILVSIGAPYWHDLLQALAALRQTKPVQKPVGP